jgi:hypothetical protein
MMTTWDLARRSRGGSYPGRTHGNGRGEGRGGGAAENVPPRHCTVRGQGTGGLVNVTSGPAGVRSNRLRLPERSRRR